MELLHLKSNIESNAEVLAELFSIKVEFLPESGNKRKCSSQADHLLFDPEYWPNIKYFLNNEARSRHSPKLDCQFSGLMSAILQPSLV